VLKEQVLKELSKKELESQLKTSLISLKEKIEKEMTTENDKKSSNYKTLKAELKQVTKALKALKY
jgi:hypothetical protein